MIPLCVPYLGDNERRYIEEALTANQPSVGPFVERFETAFAEYVGSRYAVAVSSGTAALHLAMRILDVGPGDEVLAPTFSFVATVNPILYVGAKPVLVDACPKTWCIDPTAVSSELHDRAERNAPMPKAVVVSHLYGHAAQLQALTFACEDYGVPIIEDAAESLGATWNASYLVGRQVGTVGTVGCFSFNGNKILTTGQGGMLVTDYYALAEKARHLRAQARLPGPEYVHDAIGYNYRMPNLAAAMGLAQLEQLPGFLERKRGMAQAYDVMLGGLVQLAPRAPWCEPSSWLYSIRTEDPESLRRELAFLGIESRRLWMPLHFMAAYAKCEYLGGEVAEKLHAHGLSLPSSVGLTAAEQSKVVSAVKNHLTVRKECPSIALKT